MKCKRITSLCVLAAFLATNHFSNQGYALSENLPADAVSSPVFPKSLNEIQIPEAFGKIQSRFQGSGDQSVIIVQDAHAIPDAQKNIERLISFF